MGRDGAQFNKEKPSMDATEAELVQRVVLRGDTEALSALYRLNYSAIYAYFCKRVRDKHEAEMLAAETFKRVVEALKAGRYQERGTPFSAWLFGIARLVYLEYRRNLPPSPMEEIDDNNSDETNALDILIEQENVTVLWQWVAELDEDERTVIHLHYRERLSYGKIALALGRTPGACKQLNHRALEKLRKKAKSSGFWKPDN